MKVIGMIAYVTGEGKVLIVDFTRDQIYDSESMALLYEGRKVRELQSDIETRIYSILH